MFTEATVNFDGDFEDCASLPAILSSVYYTNGFDYTGPLPTIPASMIGLSCNEGDNATLALVSGDYRYKRDISFYMYEAEIVISTN